VLEWTQAVLAAGEAFSGSESATLRDALQRQSGRFFAAYHSANMQARARRAAPGRRLRTGQLPAASCCPPRGASSRCAASERHPQWAGAISLAACQGQQQTRDVVAPATLPLESTRSRSRPQKPRAPGLARGRERSARRAEEAGWGGGQAMQAMLEREVWRRLPLVPGPLPSVLAALEGAGAAAPAAAFDSGDFGAWVARGNPWQEPARDADGSGEGDAEDGSGGGGGGGGGAREDDDEAAELFGESIDEESQRVRVRAGGAGRGDDAGPVVTSASWRLARWLAEYAQLMRVLRSDAGRVWSGAAELFELYLLHTYATFADVGLMEVLGRGGARPRHPFPFLPTWHALAADACAWVGVRGARTRARPRQDVSLTLPISAGALTGTVRRQHAGQHTELTACGAEQRMQRRVPRVGGCWAWSPSQVVSGGRRRRGRAHCRQRRRRRRGACAPAQRARAHIGALAAAPAPAVPAARGAGGRRGRAGRGRRGRGARGGRPCARWRRGGLRRGRRAADAAVLPWQHARLAGAQGALRPRPSRMRRRKGPCRCLVKRLAQRRTPGNAGLL